ncbi:MAG TPA: Ig-like domain repeat protein [Terracidiphilus sp.]|nr:Ig-like domain repeat protein [Terracidiphilus sp.]
MKPQSLSKVALSGLALALICALPMASHAQASLTAAAEASPGRTITLDPPTGLDLQAQTLDSKGNLLPEAPPNFRRLGEATVGKQADLHALTLRFGQTTRITGISVTKDFTIEQGGSCVEGNVYEKGSTCRLLVRFTPRGPGNRLGKLTVAHSASATPDAFGLGGYGYSPVITFIPSIITTVPGTYPSSKGLLSGAQNLTVDGSDNLYIADTGNNVIRYMDSSGNFKTLASSLSGPLGITVDQFGEVFFSEPTANALYEIWDFGLLVDITGAGTGTCTIASPCPVTTEAMFEPGQMSVDPYDNIFFAENKEGAGRLVALPYPPEFGELFDPFNYQESQPDAFAVDADDNLYSYWNDGGLCAIVTQTFYNAENSIQTYQKVVGGRVCGFSGDGGQAGSAEIGAVAGQITFDAAGDLYFTDTDNQRVRRVDYITGTIRTIAGNGTAGYTNDGSGATNAELSSPTGVAVDSQGQVYIISSAATGQVIRKVTATGIRGFVNQVKGTPSGPVTVVVTNTGNSVMQLTGAGFSGANPSDFSLDPNLTSCVLTAGATLNAGQSCQIGFIFTPSAIGGRSATYVLADNTVDFVNTIDLMGTGVLPSATFTITSPTNGASFTSGSSVTFSVKVSSTSGPAPTGTVQFKVDGTDHGSPVTLSSGVASTTVTGLSVAGHTLSAAYSGDSNYAAGGPISVSITVTSTSIAHPPTVVMTPMATAATSCMLQPFEVTVSSASGIVPTGTVHLMNGNRGVSSATLANGKAVVTSPPLPAGTYSFRAQYSGDAHNGPGVSAAVVETIAPPNQCAQPAD